MHSVPHVSQGQGPDGVNHRGMATNKSLGEWNTKSTAGKLEAEVPILSVYVNDIRTVKYNIETASTVSLQGPMLWIMLERRRFKEEEIRIQPT